MGDIKTDGKFIIENGGITQGIQKELNLSDEECNQLQKNSVWDEIVKEFNDFNNVTIESDAKSSDNNSIQNAVVQFTRESWQRIVNIVNRVLHRNIELEETEEENETPNKEKADIECSTPQDEPAANTPQAFPDRKDKIPADLTPNDVYLLTMYNDMDFANKKGVKLGDKYYDFNKNGECERIYRDKPTQNMNGMPNSYTLIVYDENSEVVDIYQFIGQGDIDPDGTRTCGIYDKNGKLTSFYVESDFDPVSQEARTRKSYTADGEFEHFTSYFFDENGKQIEQHFHDKYGKIDTICLYDKDGAPIITYDPNSQLDNFAARICSILDNLTEEDFQTILSEIENTLITIDDESEYSETDNLYFVMEKYAECTGRFMLDDIAQKNKQLADYLINYIKAQETAETETTYKYTKNILADMAEHPDDYKKLTVDVMRLMHRPKIDKEDDHGDNRLKLNNIIDKNVYQMDTGNCYLISNIKSIDSKPLGRKALKSLRQNLPNGDVLITCKGNNKTYLITKEEILDSDHLSTGDDDMRVYEIAMDKYRRDVAYSDPSAQVDDYAGTLQDVCKAFFGIGEVAEYDIADFNFEEINDENLVFDFHISTTDKDATIPQASSKNRGNVDIETNHAYRVVRKDSERVYFINPWDTSEELSMSIEEFKQIKNLRVSKFDLRLIK